MLKTKSSKTYFGLLLLTVVAIAVAFSLGGADRPPTTQPAADWPRTPASQLIFFAVLEGLYRDGVSTEEVDLIIPPGENGRPKFDEQHFVYACPLCHPAFEAFRLYRQREPIFGLKARIDTFGPGLNETFRVGLRSQDPNQRRQTIEALISRWVGQRLDLMRLSADERQEITNAIGKGRKQGMGGLKRVAEGTSQVWTNCAICDGSFGACKIRSETR